MGRLLTKRFFQRGTMGFEFTDGFAPIQLTQGPSAAATIHQDDAVACGRRYARQSCGLAITNALRDQPKNLHALLDTGVRMFVAITLEFELVFFRKDQWATLGHPWPLFQSRRSWREGRLEPKSANRQ